MNTPRLILTLFVTCLGVFAGGPALSAQTGGPAALALRPTAEVDGRGVYLDELLAEPGPVGTNVLLAPAPPLNQALVLTRKQLTDLLASHALPPDLVLSNWSGAEQVRVTRRTRRLEEAELRELLTAVLQRDLVREKGDLELRLSRPWTPVLIPDDPFDLRVVELPTAGVTPNCVIRFELVAGKETYGPWQVPAQARIWREVLVARSAAPRGRLLREADLGSEKRDVLLLRDTLDVDRQNDASLEMAETLPVGSPVLARSVRKRPVVRRGYLLEAFVQEGAFRISVRVEALEDGLPGQSIRVRNAKSKREFLAQVQNESTVIVPL